MNLLAPWALLAGLSIPAIALLWMLRLRRRRLTVPSTLLWQRSIVDQAANAPLQKLRSNLLLILQILAAALLALALARPVIQATTSGGSAVLILVDQSASMASQDGAGDQTRLEEALEAASRLVNSLPSGRQAAVVSFANRATVLQPFTSDRGALLEALTTIRPTDLPTVADEALALAASLAGPVGAGIHVFSDGGFDASQIRLKDDQALEFTKVGTRSRNVGITAADIRRPGDSATTATYQVFLNVRNFGDEAASGKLEVYANGKLVDNRAVSLPAQGEQPQIFFQSGLDSPEIEFRLAVNNDDLPADNSAFVVLQPPQQRRVVLVSAGSYFLERALRSTPGMSLSLERVSPGQWSDRLAEEADLVVFDGTCPATRLPAGNYLFIQCLPPMDGFVRTGTLESPGILDWDNAHPLLRYVQLDDVVIQRAAQWQLPSSAQTIVESQQGPLVAVWSANNVNAVLWAFDIFETNLPLRMAFPILTANSAEWLMRRGRQPEARTGQTGSPVQVEVSGAAGRVTMTDPDNRGWELATDGGRSANFDRTYRVGFYRTTVDSKPGPVFGISLLDEKESQTQPADYLATQGSRIEGKSAGSLQTSNREIWGWAILAMLSLVILEWLVYHRRILMK